MMKNISNELKKSDEYLPGEIQQALFQEKTDELLENNIQKLIQQLEEALASSSAQYSELNKKINILKCNLQFLNLMKDALGKSFNFYFYTDFEAWENQLRNELRKNYSDDIINKVIKNSTDLLNLIEVKFSNSDSPFNAVVDSFSLFVKKWTGYSIQDVHQPTTSDIIPQQIEKKTNELNDLTQQLKQQILLIKKITEIKNKLNKCWFGKEKKAEKINKLDILIRVLSHDKDFNLGEDSLLIKDIKDILQIKRFELSNYLPNSIKSKLKVNNTNKPPRHLQDFNNWHANIFSKPDIAERWLASQNSMKKSNGLLTFGKQLGKIFFSINDEVQQPAAARRGA